MSRIDLLTQGLKELGIDSTDSQIASYSTYLAELKKWNSTYNLTALKTDEDIIIKHFLDSLLYLQALPPGFIRIADVGTGGGFPGIPIRIMRPDIELTLIEPSRKKVSFLRNIVKKLSIPDAGIVHKRIEQLGETFHHYFDIILSRATFGLHEFHSLCCPFLTRSGRLVISKGPKGEDEAREFREATKTINPVESIMPANLPFSDAKRYIIILKC